MAWWFTPAVMIGVSLYVKGKVGKAKYRWLRMTEEDVRKLPVLLAISKSEGGESLPELELGWRWKPIRLTYAVSPFSPPSDVEIHVMEKALAVPSAPAAATSYATEADLDSLMSISDIEDLGRRPHRPRRHWIRGPYWRPVWDPWYVAEPIYIEQIPVLTQPEDWIVEWTSKEGKKIYMSRSSEVEARRLRDALSSAGLKATIIHRVGREIRSIQGIGEIEIATKKAISNIQNQLKTSGLSIVAIPIDSVQNGDFLVTVANGSCRLSVVRQIHMPTGRPFAFDLEEMHPSKGHRSRVMIDNVCYAFGLRRSST